MIHKTRKISLTDIIKSVHKTFEHESDELYQGDGSIGNGDGLCRHRGTSAGYGGFVHTDEGYGEGYSTPTNYSVGAGQSMVYLNGMGHPLDEAKK